MPKATDPRGFRSGICDRRARPGREARSMEKRTLVLISFVAAATLLVSACGGGKSSSANAAKTTLAASAEPSMPAPAGDASIPNCGAVAAVWVNLKTKVYHPQSDPLYGKTKHGEYLCPSQAQAQGFRPAGGGAARHRHERNSTAPT